MEIRPHQLGCKNRLHIANVLTVMVILFSLRSSLFRSPLENRLDDRPIPLNSLKFAECRGDLDDSASFWKTRRRTREIYRASKSANYRNIFVRNFSRTPSYSAIIPQTRNHSEFGGRAFGASKSEGRSCLQGVNWEGRGHDLVREIIGTTGLMASAESRIIKLNFSRISLSGGRQDADVLPIPAMSARTWRVHQVSHVSRHKIAQGSPSLFLR